ncbi:YceI family protein [Streptomyces daliensis]
MTPAKGTGEGTGRLSEPEPGVYRLDAERSSVRFATRAVFGLTPVRGSFDIESGHITVPGNVAETSVVAVISARSFRSGLAKRDHHVRSADYLDATAYPSITFRSTGLDREADGGSGVNGGSGEDDAVTLHGNLTVRDVTAPVELRVASVATDGARLLAHASAVVDRYAFGVTKAKGMTGRRLTLTLDIVAGR